MKRGIIYPTTVIKTTIAKTGESIEQMLRKANKNKEPLNMTAKMTYNDRKDGVLAQHDIRTDRFEIAMLATDKIHASEAAKRRAEDNPEPLSQIDPNKDPTKQVAPYTGGEA